MTAKIIAEIGINHNGDMDLCHKTIIAAKEAGADAVKFQNYKTESFIGQRSEFWEYKDGTKERQFDMFKRCELSFAQLQQINAWCQEIGIDWHSTPMCIPGLLELLQLNVKVIKNGSDCLQDEKLVRAMAMTGLPVVLSTGMATSEEISKAVSCFYDPVTYTYKNLTLLHCTSAYPAEDKDMNLLRVSELGIIYCGVKTGLSDHSRGAIAATVAAAMGATWIEKHFTLDNTLKGPDHWFSSDKTEMRWLVNNVRRAESMLGDKKIGMTETERENRKKWFI